MMEYILGIATIALAFGIIFYIDDIVKFFSKREK